MARGVSPGSRVVTALARRQRSATTSCAKARMNPSGLVVATAPARRQRRATTSCAKARMNPSGLVVATAPARRQYSEFSLPCLGNYHWLRATQLLRLRAKIPPLMRPSPPLVSAKGAPTAHACDLAPGAHPRPSALCRDQGRLSPARIDGDRWANMLSQAGGDDNPP